MPRCSWCATRCGRLTRSPPIIRERDFGRLRDVLRNRPGSDVAAVLADLSLEQRVLVFRILPRKTAADTFAYLSTDEQNALLRAMASEEAAALLNNMAPDDRTMFLDELPAEATRQLLALLTPEERAEAVQLLGYPEGSIGRLMTPHYVRVKEDWTIAQRARTHPCARPGQRNAQRHLRHRRERAADRRHPHPRVSPRRADQHRSRA